MENGRKHIWPVEIILTLDYKTLVIVYNRILKDHVLGRQVASDVQRRICQIREEKAPTDDLPTKLIQPNPSNINIHFQPFYMMELRDAEGQIRFFRMKDNLKTASNEHLRILQSSGWVWFQDGSTKVVGGKSREKA